MPIDLIDNCHQLKEKLVSDGFQNVAVQQNKNLLLLTYENRVYRFEPLAIEHIIKSIDTQNFPTIESIRVIAFRYNLPVIQIDFLLKDLALFQTNQITGRTFAQTIKFSQSITAQLKETEFTNKGIFKMEFEIEPQLRLGLGGSPDPVLHQIDLVPTANLFLWKGAQVKLQGILPLSSEFSAIEADWVKPGLLVFNQYIRLPYNSWSKLSLGYFEPFRYGGEVALGKYFLNGNLSLKAVVGYTGYASYPVRLFVDKPRRGWQITDIDYWNYQVGIDYRFSKWDLVVGANAGRALFFRNFYRVHFYRQFREVKLGFFAYKNGVNENYGFNLSIPIIPKKYWKPKFLSIRPARSFRYYYQATQYRLGEVNTGYNFEFIQDDFNPSFLQNQLFLN